MRVKPIWMDRDRCDYPPVFASGLLVGLAIGLALASLWYWGMMP